MSKGMKALAIILWILFIGTLLSIAYLSFQDGDDAKALGSGFIRRLAAWYYDHDDLPIGSINYFTYRFRQIGRIVLFIWLGIIGTATVHVTFCRIPWILRTIIAAVIIIAIAVFTERYKIYLPTRHFSKQEMLYSIFGGLGGFAFVSLITWVYSVVKFFSGMTINAIKNRDE